MTTYAIKAVPKIDPSQVMILRRCRSHEAAAEHALKANMEHWDDIWVEAVDEPLPPPKYTDAPLPWSAEYQGAFTYLRDANGKRVGTLYGCVERQKIIINNMAPLLEEEGVAQ